MAAVKRWLHSISFRRPSRASRLNSTLPSPRRPDRLEEAQAQLGHLGVPVRGVEAAGAEPDRVLAQLALGERAAAACRPRRCSCSRRGAGRRPGDDLGHDHLDAAARRVGEARLAARRVEATTNAFMPAKWRANSWECDRLQRARVGEPLGRRGEVVRRRATVSVRGHSMPAGGGQLVRAVLVEHREQHLVVRLERRRCPSCRAPARLRAISSSALVLAGQHDARRAHAAQPLEPALLHASLAPEVDERVVQARERRTGSPRAAERVHRTRRRAEAARHGTARVRRRRAGRRRAIRPLHARC